jgi:hypothetical protein
MVWPFRMPEQVAGSRMVTDLLDTAGVAVVADAMKG